MRRYSFALACFAIAASASYLVVPQSPIFPSTTTPSLVQSAKNQTATSPVSLGVNMGTQPVVSNIMIAGVVTDFGTNDGDVRVADNQGGNYVRLILGPVAAGSAQRASLWCAPIVASSGTYTVTATLPTNSVIGIFALEYHNGTCNPDKLTSGLTSTSPYNCGSFTTSNANDIMLTLLNIDGASGTITFTAPSGFTIEQQQLLPASGVPAAIADKINSATATFTPTFASNKNQASSPCAFVALLSK